MKSLALATILLSMFALSAQGLPTTVPRTFDFRNGTYDINEKTLVEGYTDCGSAGKILLVEFAQCEKTPCHLSVGNEYRWRLDVLIAGHHENYAIQVDVRSGDEAVKVTYFEVPFSLEPGHYAFLFDSVIQAQHKGFSYIQLRLIASQIDEACVLAEVTIQ